MSRPLLAHDGADVLQDFDFDSFLCEGSTKVADIRWQPLDPEPEVPAINRGLPPPTETPIETRTKPHVSEDSTPNYEKQGLSVSLLSQINEKQVVN